MALMDLLLYVRFSFVRKEKKEGTELRYERKEDTPTSCLAISTKKRDGLLIPFVIQLMIFSWGLSVCA